MAISTSNHGDVCRTTIKLIIQNRKSWKEQRIDLWCRRKEFHSFFYYLQIRHLQGHCFSKSYVQLQFFHFIPIFRFSDVSNQNSCTSNSLQYWNWNKFKKLAQEKVNKWKKWCVDNIELRKSTFVLSFNEKMKCKEKSRDQIANASKCFIFKWRL